VSSFSTFELVTRAQAEAVNEHGDPDAYWELVSQLHDRDPVEVWSLISPLTTHGDARVQTLVPDVLRLLGREAQPLALETLALFGKMLALDPTPELLAAIANACVDFHDKVVVTMLVPFAKHADPSVREAVLHAIRRSGQPEAIAALIELSRDEEDDLREWATFALGSQLPLVDHPEIREALAARLTDRHEGTRDEAIIGLGLRADSRALGPLRSQLERGFSGAALFEAARTLASPVLRDSLMALQSKATLDDDERADLEAAVTACTQ
jgi:hypothetical protein